MNQSYGKSISCTRWSRREKDILLRYREQRGTISQRSFALEAFLFARLSGRSVQAIYGQIRSLERQNVGIAAAVNA